MKVKDTIANFLTIAETLKAMKGKQHPKLIVIGKINLDRIVPIAKRTYEQREAVFSPEYKAFESARDALKAQFRIDNDLVSDTEDFGEKMFELETLILDLSRSDAHKVALEQFQEDLKAYDETLATEIEMELQAIDISWLPKKMNLATFVSLQPIIKDSKVFHAHELEKIDLTKGEIITIVQKVLGDGGHFRDNDKGVRPVLEMVFATPIVRRLAAFMEAAKILDCRYGLSSGGELNYRACGEILGMSHEKVRLEERIALDLLKRKYWRDIYIATDKLGITPDDN